MLKLSILPLEIQELLVFFQKKKIIFYLTGGFTRDYLLHQTFSFDVDIEIKFSPLHLQNEIEKEWGIICKRLPYEILSFELGNYNFELQAPRLESYKAQDSYGHRDFSVSIDPSLNPSQSFLRRDFSLNAIAFTSSMNQMELELEDPFYGHTDLKNKVLSTMNPNFVLDPVRFLRMVRFKVNFGLTYSESLKISTSQFDLSHLSTHYLLKEYLACKKKKEFCFEVEELCKNHKLELGPLKTKLHDLKQLENSSFNFFSEVELFVKILEEEKGESFSAFLKTQTIFLQIAKHQQLFAAWSIVKEILTEKNYEKLSAAALSALSSWERFVSSDFFQEIVPHFKKDQKLLQLWLKLTKVRLDQAEAKLLDSTAFDQRSSLSWSLRLKKELE